MSNMSTFCALLSVEHEHILPLSTTPFLLAAPFLQSLLQFHISLSLPLPPPSLSLPLPLSLPPLYLSLLFPCPSLSFTCKLVMWPVRLLIPHELHQQTVTLSTLVPHYHRCENFNALMREQNTYANHQAPSRDVATRFAVLDHIRYLCEGGSSETNTM